ncbi:hypothetical protein ACOYR4_03565 [Acidovorax sp. M14]|uniref:hypothetical protein n=1 Tax=Acidovorax sp. M14 TaxID=3411354 RepID=UPI003BF5E942
MKNLSLSSLTGPIAGGMAAVVLAGCAALGPATPEQQVKERATAFWNARLKADPQGAYALLSPSYRGIRSEKEFVQSNSRGIAAEKVEVGAVTCEAEKCTARVAITGKPAVPGLTLPVITNYMDDVWVSEQGQWWRYMAP